VAALGQRLSGVALVVDVGDPPGWPAVMRDLADRGVRRLMVEGGTTVLTQLLAQGLADELHLAVAPFFIGDSRAPRMCGDGPFPHGPHRPMRLAEARTIGDMVFLRYQL
jgi:5-amino-6-(5-phosphoribosylamino)uracil reductase